MRKPRHPGSWEKSLFGKRNGQEALGFSWELEDTSMMGAVGQERVRVDEVWKVLGQTLKNPAAMPRDQAQFETDVGKYAPSL